MCLGGEGSISNFVSATSARLGVVWGFSMGEEGGGFLEEVAVGGGGSG